MEKIALLGGTPTLEQPLPPSNNIGEEEKRAVEAVLDTGVLSDFIGRKGDKFLGGEQVLGLEKEFCEKFKVKYSVSFNSATTALDAAVCALGVGPGDEVIVSPYTMSASATAILMNGAVPVFADIDPRTFCLDPNCVRDAITPHTKAIMVTTLYGGAPDYDALLAIAKEHGLKIIEDNAQGPGGMYKDQYFGTIGDVGVFSYNCHKTIQCGEGGILVTNDDHFAYRAQLKRNHAEAVMDDDDNHEIFVLGSNYRLSEVHAAIAREQLKKLDNLNARRIELVDHMAKGLDEIPGLTPAHIVPDSKHVFYCYPIIFNEEEFGISRELFVKAMRAEGFIFNVGYLKPLYLMPLFQNRQMYPRSHFPFDAKEYQGSVSYEKGICPVTERLYEQEMVITSICRHPHTTKEIDLFISAIKRIQAQCEDIKVAQ